MKTHFFNAMTAQDRVGYRITAHLQHGTDLLAPDICQRLGHARMRALSRRKVIMESNALLLDSMGKGQFSWGDSGFDWRQRLVSGLSILALVLGLTLITHLGEEQRAAELAEMDIELLADDLPPDAYTDPGFSRFLLQHGRD